MKRISVNIIICIIIFASWAKAGLAGNWLSYTINFFTCILLILNIKDISLKVFLPFLLILLYFFVSCLNPQYKRLAEDDWKELNIDNIINLEKNIYKAKFTSDKFSEIYNYSQSNFDLSLAIYFHNLNIYNENFKYENSPKNNLLIKYKKLISLDKTKFLPSILQINNNKILNFLNFFFQILFGFIVYITIKDYYDVTKILNILSLNCLILTICGLIQKFNYSPADDLKEIWGIWDTPEPRYYFASFTYKNHWSCFAISIF